MGTRRGLNGPIGGTGSTFSGTPLTIIGTDNTGALINIPNGVSGTVLTSTGPSSLPTWQTVGTSTSAHNLVGGLANEVPFQSAPNTTTFTSQPTAPNQVLTFNGTTLVWALPSNHSKNVVLLTGSGTYTSGANVSWLEVWAVGGGGGSGGVASNPAISGGGGAGGAVYAIFPAGSYAYIVGGGGPAGTSSSNGGNGGDSTFGAVLALQIVGFGGSGSTFLPTGVNASTSLGGLGNTGIAGGSVPNPIIIQGQDGECGTLLGCGGSGGSPGFGLGLGGRPNAVVPGGGAIGTGYGWGVSGTMGQMGSNYNGNIGGPGTIIIHEYFA